MKVDNGKNVYNKISNLSKNFDTILEISEGITLKVTQQEELLQNISNIVDKVDVML